MSQPKPETEQSPLHRVLALLSRKDRYRLALVIGASLIAAFFELLSVASILPFMTILVSPDSAFAERLSGLMSGWLGIESRQSQLITIGVVTLVAVVSGNLVSAANLWVQNKYLASVKRSVAQQLFDGYLAQPYLFHIARDSSSLGKVILSDASIVIDGYLASIIAMMSRVMIVIALVGLVILQDPAVALAAAVGVGGVYAGLYLVIKNRLYRLGQRLAESGEQRHRVVMETLGGVKELIVSGKTSDASEAFRDATLRFTQAEVSNTLLSMMPRYALETVAFGGIVIVALILLMRQEASAAIPVLALYAFAGYRLMPAVQQLYGAIVNLRFFSPAVAILEGDMRAVGGANHAQVSVSAGPMVFDSEISLQNVTFAYEGAERNAVDHVSLVIRRNESIGLVGKTGSGKTTLVDLMLGLYTPQGGRILVDGVPVTPANVAAWRANLGYVPQHVFLKNASIAENVALGVPPADINRELVQNALRMAQAEEFVSLLPSGMDTVVGERGVRLSGGQRQRLGIARALYLDPKVIFFDEATSALDGETEAAVMSAIRALAGSRTIILIAHRLKTVQACDRIVMLDNGKVIADGPYDELLSTSLPFRRLAGEAAGR
jgi:ABC-type multidrug transport system fused ATPase/permease subunit